MPLYEYECSDCGERFEVIQKFSDKPVKTCRKCGGKKVERLISSSAIQFKGTGWYVTDYARKGSSSDDSKSGASDSSSGDSDKKSAGGKKDAGKSPAKTNKS